MARALIIVPYAFGENGLAHRRAQQAHVKIPTDIEFEYRSIKAGPRYFLGRHDEFLIEVGIFEAGIDAQNEGFDAVSVDTMSDSGVAELRAVLDIPVVAPGRTMFSYALMLGGKFAILAQDDPQYPQYHSAGLTFYRNLLKKTEFTQFCSGIEFCEAPSDAENLYDGHEAEVFPRMAEAGRRAIDAGAEVLCLGSTTMHQAGPYLSEHLPVPALNPGPVSYKIIQAMLGLGHSHSRAGHPSPIAREGAMVHAMLDAARALKEEN